MKELFFEHIELNTVFDADIFNYLCKVDFISKHEPTPNLVWFVSTENNCRLPMRVVLENDNSLVLRDNFHGKHMVYCSFSGSTLSVDKIENIA